MNKIQPISLTELNASIKGVLKQNLTSYWLMAEVSELSINYSGHCYLELVEKNPVNENIIARSRATIWSARLRMIKPYFETTTGIELQAGIKIMVKAQVEFHEVYGLSLNITDIEPTYTVGDMALRKQKIIQKLIEEGVLEMNKELFLPALPQKLAIISSITAAGLEDFLNQLEQNNQGYQFYTKVFPAVMQGNEAEASIIAALDKIYKYEEFFDAVVIIRGGGSQTDLECFNSYWLAYHITQFPLPILTGIGHEQDDSVADLVAHTRLKTPTAVAEYLIDLVGEVEEGLLNIEEQIIDFSRDILQSAREKIQLLAQKMDRTVKFRIQKEKHFLSQMNSELISQSKLSLRHKRISLQKKEDSIKSGTGRIFLNAQHKLQNSLSKLSVLSKKLLNENTHRIQMFEKSVQYLNPYNILERGYSITSFNNKAVKDAKQLHKGDILETKYHNGTSKSIVE